jgi:hypothetical protein
MHVGGQAGAKTLVVGTELMPAVFENRQSTGGGLIPNW